MITSVIGYLAYILGSAALIMYLTKKYPKKIFQYIPGIVIIYLVTMLMYSVGLWQMNDDITAARKFIQNNFVPMMVFLMCLRCNVKSILKLGPKLLAIFFAGSLTVCIGFFISFLLIGRNLDHGADIFAIVNASYVGASQNFLATANALALPDANWGDLLLMVNIPYAIWVMLLVIAGPYADRFNKWTKADVSSIHAVAKDLDAAEEAKYFNDQDILIVCAVSVVAVAVCRFLAELTPEVGFINASVWEYLYVTLLGLFLAPTRAGKLKGSDEIASFLILVTITVAASYTNILQIGDSVWFIVACFLALLIHAALLYVCAKRSWDLHSI